jgi:nitrogen fixation protein NifU and related proteins
MSDGDLRSLYQEVLLDHYKRPRNFGTLESPTGRGEGNNPLCGDRLTVEVAVAEDRVERIAFRGAGCAISTASASLMSEAVAGHTVQEAKALGERFRAALTAPAAADAEALGKLIALAGVKEFPMRVKCATLAWHALAAALAGGGLVSTE